MYHTSNNEPTILGGYLVESIELINVTVTTETTYNVSVPANSTSGPNGTVSWMLVTNATNTTVEMQVADLLISYYTVEGQAVLTRVLVYDDSIQQIENFTIPEISQLGMVLRPLAELDGCQQNV